MLATDSALDPERLAAARALLRPAPKRKEKVWPALAAAAFAALTALVLAASMVIAPTLKEPAVAAYEAAN